MSDYISIYRQIRILHICRGVGRGGKVREDAPSTFELFKVGGTLLPTTLVQFAM